MHRVPIISRDIIGAGYDATIEVLELAFRDGKVERYVDVPPPVFQTFMVTGDKEGFVKHELEPNYPHGRIS